MVAQLSQGWWSGLRADSLLPGSDDPSQRVTIAARLVVHP